jgi:hypothetical protein
VFIPYQQRLLTSEIRHAGGKPIAASSAAFRELKRWLDNGANRDGLAPPAAANRGQGECNNTIPPTPGRPAVDTTTDAYRTFVETIQPTIVKSCAFATCHSSPQSDFYVTCGASDEQTQFNYSQAADFVVAPMIAVEQSEI